MKFLLFIVLSPFLLLLIAAAAAAILAIEVMLWVVTLPYRVVAGVVDSILGGGK